MDKDPKSALGLLNRGIQTFDDGDLAEARDLFAQALREEPENEVAWLWLAEASDDLGEKRYCLDRAVAINPDSAGLPKREALRTARVEPAVPAAIRDLAKPGLPPSLQAAKPATASSLRKKLPWRRSSGKASGPAATPLRKPWVWVALAAVAALLLVGAWYAFLRSDEPELDAIHFAVAPLTGENASIGREVRNAAMIAQDDINSSISVGPKVELVFFDDQNDPDLAVEVASRSWRTTASWAWWGTARAAPLMAAAPIYADANMPVITGQATIDALSNFPNYFRTIYANSDEARILTQYLQVDLGQDRARL
ncbi:MAG: ABC transporter substrate-binding protein [Thermomicrobiales bacterium]